MPPKPNSATDENPKPKKSRRRKVDKDSPEYKVRRDRNNIAVRKSRSQTKEKTKQTLARVSQLRSENEELEQQVKLLAKELGVLKDLFKMSHSGAPALPSLEAAIQTEDDEVGDDEAAAVAAVARAVGAAGPADPEMVAPPTPPSDYEVNTHALRRDHEYGVKCAVQADR